MHDGREGRDLETQALNAILTHAEPSRDPRPEELTAIARFQESLFSHTAVKAFLHSGAELRLPDGNTPSEIRGRAFFEPDRQCGICHSGPMLNRTSEFHPDPAARGGRFESTSVGTEPDNPESEVRLVFRRSRDQRDIAADRRSGARAGAYGERQGVSAPGRRIRASR